MKCILIEMPDGSLTVRGGLSQSWLKRRFAGDEDAALQYVLDVLVPRQNPGAVSAEIVDVQFPDRTFRGAWKKGGGRVDVDMPKARAIHMDRIRVARDAELARLDVEYQRADEDSDIVRKQEVAARKKSLRDIPQTFDLTVAETPESLAALWPRDLPARPATA